MTTASGFKLWSGEEWQSHVAMLLKRHYRPGQFQEIPDAHRGDAGLEGFSNDGCAYQCYAPEEPLDLPDRADRHKKKIYRDIQKFCKNKDLLTRMFGPIQICCWILVVPKFDSKDVISYGELQAAEVRKLSLPYVAANFCVRIITDDQFALEREQLMNVGLAKVAVPVSVPAPADIETWAVDHKENVRVLDGKLGRMKPTSSEEAKRSLREKLIGHFVSGQNAIAHLHENFEEVYEQVLRLKNEHEQFLSTESLTAVGLPIELLRTTITAYESRLDKDLLGIDSHTAKALVWEAIADWLMRCPLDFEEVP